jgi:Ca-activated chloride channel family protein
MEREKAKVGDITVTLCWDDRADLDLHAICPNGNHIHFGDKQGGSIEGGGYLDVDMNVQGESVEPVENVFFGDT